MIVGLPAKVGRRQTNGIFYFNKPGCFYTAPEAILGAAKARSRNFAWLGALPKTPGGDKQLSPPPFEHQKNVPHQACLLSEWRSADKLGAG